jgi:ABC-type Fe3+/spermidine/putrescine transport system ATPase subunit
MEALTMSDRVAVMQEGVFVEAAAPRDIYLRPRAAFTAAFLGDTNLIAGTIMTRTARNGMWQIDTAHGLLICPAGDWLDRSDSVWIACRPEGLLLTATAPEGENVLPGRITAAIFAGDQITYRLAIGDQVLQAKSAPFSSFQEGERVFVQLPPERCLLMRRADRAGS